MNYRSSATWLLLASSAALLLAACGGGSSSASLEAASARGGKGFSQAVPAQGMGEATLPSKAARADGEAEAAAAHARQASRLFIVQLAEDPALVYSGGISGYAATKPAQGRKIDPNSPAVVNYAGYLTKRHDDTLAGVGGGRKAYSYVYGFNGFAAELSDAQANALATTPGVLSVVRNEIRQLDTATTPTFLGLNATGGFWSRAKGENVIIGIIDGGITPEHPSFSDRTDVNGNGTQDGKLGYQQIPGWHGKCEPGVAFNASHCNQKLIGARYYNEGYGGADGVLSVLPYEFISPRDYDGHGTHTASTAGGNANVPVTGRAAALGTVSGIAPRARIAAYKVCWGIGGTANAGCWPVDSVAAIDQAIADGVDVINFSISGSRTNLRDPVEIAFLRAAQAGIFVAASAGNSGPTNGTVAHPSPWITTVAAGTHPRNGTGSVTLGNGATFLGASFANAVGPAPLIRSRDAGLAGADPALLALCYGAADGGGARLDPALVAGKVVVCERGGNALVNKSAAVLAAGGVGMVLANTPTSANTQLALIHSVPTVHTAAADYVAINTYAAASGGTATINQSAVVNNLPAPSTASFSSRGPLAATGDLLKPDLIAPGQDILAAVAPYTYGGESFSLLSGTSMSSPHVAGLAALMKELHPSWSPMAIKSALMTTGTNVLDGAETSAGVIVRQGAGHVNPN
ncbi:MAG TPA: S8 family peptidase, partial [Burkholderiaceae bacterium]|nr:S8 family peptidase [Burkholderiaceae bacterium]